MVDQLSVQERRPRALENIGFNSLYNSDIGTSSEDETTEATRDIEPTDAQSIVSVSLGPEQKRLLSPNTPAVEKSAAIEAGGGFFGPSARSSLEDVPEVSHEQDEETSDSIARIDGQQDGRETRGRQEAHPAKPTSPQMRLPSPWRATPRVFQKDDYGSAARGFSLSRGRASSGPLSATWDGWQKSLMNSLPSLPKSFTSGFPTSFSSKRRNDSPAKVSSVGRHTQRSLHPPPSDSPLARPRSKSEATALDSPVRQSRDDSMIPRQSAIRVVNHPKSPPPLTTYPSHLRRATSDESLQLRSALSRVSTLGDDSRFEDVKEQINSRAKAIRDSFQDSNIRLPSLPSLNNLSFESLRPDFSFSSRSYGQRRSVIDLPNSNSGLTVNGSTPGPTSPTPEQTAQNVRAIAGPTQGGPTTKAAVTHPHFTKACAEMTGDLVVLGGYRGSILRSADPPHRQLWVPVKVGLNIRKVNLEIGLNVPEDDAKMESKIVPGGMLSHIGPVDVSRRLFRRLRACENVRVGKLRIHDYGYDWRLDPEFLSEKMIEYLEKLPCNRPGTPRAERGATVIAHSLGGLITRRAVNKRPDLFAGVVYAGTPTTCINILGPLRNGDDVLLSSRVLTAQVNFTIRTSFALLPLDGKCFFNKDTKEEFPVDFFDPQTWIDYRLSPCVARPLPSLEAPPPGMIEGFMSSLSSALPSIPGRRSSLNPSKPSDTSKPLTNGHSSDHATQEPTSSSKGTELEPSEMDHTPSSSIATAVTLPHAAAVSYLSTVLSRIKTFKQSLDFIPSHAEQNIYPPAAVIYGKSTPTVYGAKVKDREAIKRADAYHDLAFASGDGVVLARAAMLPDGYELARGGLVSSERGHITLLGDLEAVGRALNAIRRSRGRGKGLGVPDAGS